METKSTNGRGGRRAGAGRPKGALNRGTLARLASGELKLPQLTRGEAIALARSKSADMLAVLCVIASDTKAPGAARVNAASAVLAYGFGRPRAMPEERKGAPKRSDGPMRLVRPGDSDFELPGLEVSGDSCEAS